MFLKNVFLSCLASMAVTVAHVSLAGELDIAANSTNALGLDLLPHVAKPDENALISPYSIQSVLAMAYAGADGETKTEIAKVLHYPEREEKLHASFKTLGKDLDSDVEVANRLFGMKGFSFRAKYRDLLRENYGADLEEMDSATDPAGASEVINRWVSDATHTKIPTMVSPENFNKDTRLVLVNAVYFKSPWAEPFEEDKTKVEPFFIRGSKREEVKTMINCWEYGYRKESGYTAVTLPYEGNELQMLILLPDAKDGVALLERALSPKEISSLRHLPRKRVMLYLPRFKFQLPPLALSETLQGLGMRKAFDVPRNSADFSRMAVLKPREYLYISNVVHRTFIEVNEEGTEAAAAKRRNSAFVFRRGKEAGADPSPSRPAIPIRHSAPGERGVFVSRAGGRSAVTRFRLECVGLGLQLRFYEQKNAAGWAAF